MQQKINLQKNLIKMIFKNDKNKTSLSAVLQLETWKQRKTSFLSFICNKLGKEGSSTTSKKI